MGWVADVSSLCLDCKGKGEQEIESKKEVSKRINFNHREKSKGYAHWKDKAKLKVMYSCSVASAGWGVFFLLLPRVLLAGVVSIGGRGAAGLGLLANLGLLVDLSLIGPFLTGARTFMTLTFFSQPGG